MYQTPSICYEPRLNIVFQKEWNRKFIFQTLNNIHQWNKFYVKDFGYLNPTFI